MGTKPKRGAEASFTGGISTQLSMRPTSSPDPPPFALNIKNNVGNRANLLLFASRFFLRCLRKKTHRESITEEEKVALNFPHNSTRAGEITCEIFANWLELSPNQFPHELNYPVG
jgi:hypothetical protein